MIVKTKINNEIVEVEVPDVVQEIPKEIQIEDLKQKLSETDYIACKIAEGVATTEEYADVIAQRQAWREEINKLEGSNG